MLGAGLSYCVLGATFHCLVQGLSIEQIEEFSRMPRGEQVWADVTRREPAKWLAIDDAIEDWPKSLLSHLVPCEGQLGLSDVRAQRRLRSFLESLRAL
jgi:hypothetical protein